jgi:hypothetical protein
MLLVWLLGHGLRLIFRAGMENGQWQAAITSPQCQRKNGGTPALRGSAGVPKSNRLPSFRGCAGLRHLLALGAHFFATKSPSISASVRFSLPSLASMMSAILLGVTKTR